MRRLFALLIVILFLGCKAENLEKAKAVLSEDESIPEIQVSILFDNSISYKKYVDNTLENVKKLFQYLASEYGNDEKIAVSLILVDTNATIIFNGKAVHLQRAYDDVSNILKNGQSKYTDLSKAINRSIYFLQKNKARRKMVVMFTDMKASTPKYHPGNEPVVPPPPDFPWDELKKSGIEIYAFFVPLDEWMLWEKLSNEKGVKINVKLPEEMKTESAYNLIFGEEQQ